VIQRLMERCAARWTSCAYWTSSFTAEVTDVFVLEADRPAEPHKLNQDLHGGSRDGRSGSFRCRWAAAAWA
jgi:hypothetical protein